MSLVVFDIECLKGGIVNELGVFEDGILGYSSLPPKDNEPTFQAKRKNKSLLRLIGTMENCNIMCCHQSFTNLVLLQGILC